MTDGRERAPEDVIRRLLLNGGALLGAYVLPRSLTFGAGLVAARLLGPAQFGAYGTAASFAMILSILATLGMLPLLVRELARQPERAETVLRAAHLIKLAASGVMVIAVYVVADRLLGYAPEVVLAALLLAIGHVFTAFGENLGAWFQAQERMHVWLEANVVFGLVSGCAGIALVAVTRSIPFFAAAFAAGQLAALLWLWYRMPARPRRKSDHVAAEVTVLLRTTIPFAIAFLALTIFYKFDVLLLERWSTADDVGVYAAGYKLADIVHALAVIAASALYPRLARLNTEEARTGASRRALELFLLAGVAGSGLLFILRTPLTHLLFGAAYTETAGVLGLLAPALAALVINILAGYLLSAANRIDLLAVAYIGACAFKLVLGLLWIPGQGAAGMALAKLVAETLLAGTLLVLLARAGAGAPARAALGLAAAGVAIAWAGGWATHHMTPLLVAVPYAAAIAWLYVKGQALSPSEVQALRGAFARRGSARPQVAHAVNE